MSRHSFDPEIAKQVGVNAAVIYQNLFFWIEKNAANGTNLIDGKYWTYNSYQAYSKLFPYLSQKQIITALTKLVDAKLIKKGKHNKNKYDQTNWYSLCEGINPNGQMGLSEQDVGVNNAHADPSAQTDNSIDRTNINSDIKQVLPYEKIDNIILFDEVWDEYPTDRRREREKCRNMFKKALDSGDNPEAIILAAEMYASETRTHDRRYVKFLDNWLRGKSWLKVESELAEERQNNDARFQKGLENVCLWLNEKATSKYELISKLQIVAILDRGLLTKQEISESGFEL